jgi:hypothetical protein
MNVAMAAFLLVLVLLVAFAVASFFRHTLTALLVLVAIPTWVVLQEFMGAGYAVFAIALVAVFAALIHTITDTLGQLRNAKPVRERPPALAERGAASRRSDRSRIAA